MNVGTLGCYVRAAFYRLLLAYCAPNCVISFGTHFSDRRAQIGEHVYIGADCDIGRAVIEDDVLIGSGVHILSGKRQHFFGDIDTPIRLQGGEMQEVRVGADTWIGNGAIIMANVGRHTVVGAGAVVTHDVDEYSVVGGNPATLLRKRITSRTA